MYGEHTAASFDRSRTAAAPGNVCAATVEESKPRLSEREVKAVGKNKRQKAMRLNEVFGIRYSLFEYS